MATIEKLLSLTKIIPVIVIDDSKHAVQLGETLVDAGLPVAEVTLRTPESWLAIEKMLNVQGLEVGVGSVKSEADITRAKELGVSFAVSPGFTEAIGKAAQVRELTLFPGVSTPSEVLSALALGFSVLKWFPAESMGGISNLKAISAPFPGVKFIPTGGINAKNANDYLAEACVAAIGGSWMVSRDNLQQEKFEEIKNETRAAVELVGRKS
jgi:2-dehydro-3-deoxyphosphogluconate aldolase / (4S)-4-hydroxy-2-oxoglutarate aldolase